MADTLITTLINLPSDQVVSTPETAKTLTSGKLVKASTGNTLIDSDYGDEDIAGKVDKAGDTMTGALVVEDNVTAEKILTPEIKTDTTTATDLTVITGTEKTLVLATPVYNDANVGGLALRAGATTPPITQWVDNAGNNTGVYGLGFAVNDEANGSIEIPHDYKEGTDLVFHLHWGANNAPSGTDYVKWQLTYFITGPEDTTPAPPTPLVKETAYDTQYEHMICNFTAITGTNLKIGDQFNFNIKRITADGDAYAGVAIMETIGFHYQCDTVGSRTITAK